MQQLLTTTAAIFLAASILNVVLNTIKSIVTVKGSTFSAAMMNAIAFGFYTCIVKMISTVDLVISVPLTMLANIIGVYFAKWFLNLFKKDKLWRISCTIPAHKGINLDAIIQKLNEYNIGYTLFDYNKGNIIDIFSKSQGESTLIKEIIDENKIKYTVYEIDKSL